MTVTRSTGWSAPGCHGGCGMLLYTDDEGRLVKVEGDPDDPFNQGRLCARCLDLPEVVHSPERQLYPLKRAKEDCGKDKWERISWDQAMDEIAGKLMSIKERYGSESVAIWSLAAGAPPSAGHLALMPARFGNLFGVTCPMASIGLDNGPFYSEFYMMNQVYPHIIYDPRNCIGTDLIYVWGCNPIENQMRIAQNLVRAREAGAKIVDLGLIFDGTAGFADEFYGMKPASDANLAMYMISYILENDLQDSAYLVAKTNAAYMVREDDGLLAKDAAGNYLVMDADTGELVAVAPECGPYPCENVALYAEAELDGVKLKSALSLLKELAADYTVEYAAEQTGLKPEQIVKLAKEYAEAETAYIMAGYGMRYTNANETYRLLHYLGILTGRLGKPKCGVIEGLQAQGFPLVTNDAAVTMPEGPESVKSVGIRMPDWFEIAQTKDSPYKALLVAQGNPVHQQPDRQRWLDVIDGMELVVDIDVWLTDTGESADYVLPDLMPFEREDLITSACYNHIVLQEPAIEPQVDGRDAVYIWSELGKRCGLGEYFQYTGGDYINMRLDLPFEYPPLTSIEPKVTYERLKEEKMIRMNVPADIKLDPFVGEESWPTKTGRIELYAERLADLGLALSKPLKPLKIGASEEYPYQLFTGRQRFFMQSSFTDDPINIALSGDTPSTRINPKDAVELKLKAGDKVEVYNDRGHVVTRLEIDESVPAGTIHVWFGWRRHQFEEGTYAEITTQCSNKQTAGPVQDRWFEDYVAAGNDGNPMINMIVTEVGSTDAYWDSYCNIRPYVKEA